MVSVIVPVFNQAHITAQFIRQWERHIGDTAELIIVSDGSTDGTEELLRLKGVKYHHRPKNLGFPKTCNEGADLASGEILVFVNNDVLFDESFIPPVEAVIEEYRGRCLFGANLIDTNATWNRFGNKIIPYLVGWFLGSTKSLFYELGKFDEIYSPYDYEDLDLSYAAFHQGLPLVQLPLRIEHLGSQSFGNLMNGREVITRRNRELFASKWGLQT